VYFRVQLGQLVVLEHLASKDHKEIKAEMVHLEKLVHQETKVPKENQAYKALLDCQ